MYFTVDNQCMINYLQDICGIEVENNFLLESLAACENVNSNFVMYFTMNKAFVNHVD